MLRIDSNYVGHIIRAQEKGVARKIEGRLKSWARSHPRSLGLSGKVIEGHDLGGKVLLVPEAVPREVIKRAIQRYSGICVNYAA